MSHNEPTEPPEDDDVESLDAPRTRDQDGVASLRDTDAEQGDDAGITDDFDLDKREAREVGVQLDSTGDQEPGLD
jgi:hypothetical protein